MECHSFLLLWCTMHDYPLKFWLFEFNLRAAARKLSSKTKENCATFLWCMSEGHGWYVTVCGLFILQWATHVNYTVCYCTFPLTFHSCWHFRPTVGIQGLNILVLNCLVTKQWCKGVWTCDVFGTSHWVSFVVAQITHLHTSSIALTRCTLHLFTRWGFSSPLVR